MDCGGLEKGIEELKVKEEDNLDVQITTFSELVNDVGLHFQIIRFPKQVFPHQTLPVSIDSNEKQNKVSCFS